MSRKILLIDDDALFRRSLSFHLRQAGYQVQTAASAEDGLSIIRNNLPDLVLLDIGLPGMDGLDALHYIKDDVKIPVIFITARHRELDEILGLELGADDYITKPFFSLHASKPLCGGLNANRYTLHQIPIHLEILILSRVPMLYPSRVNQLI